MRLAGSGPARRCGSGTTGSGSAVAGPGTASGNLRPIRPLGTRSGLTVCGCQGSPCADESGPLSRITRSGPVCQRQPRTARNASRQGRSSSRRPSGLGRLQGQVPNEPGSPCRERITTHVDGFRRPPVAWTCRSANSTTAARRRWSWTARTQVAARSTTASSASCGGDHGWDRGVETQGSPSSPTGALLFLKPPNPKIPGGRACGSIPSVARMLVASRLEEVRLRG